MCTELPRRNVTIVLLVIHWAEPENPSFIIKPKYFPVRRYTHLHKYDHVCDDTRFICLFSVAYFLNFWANIMYTSMHSSRMRTARLLPVSPSMHCMVGGGCLLLGGVCSGVSVSGPGGGGSASGPRGCLPLVRGGGWWCVSQHAMGQTPHLWTEFLTHASENITLPQLRCGR